MEKTEMLQKELDKLQNEGLELQHEIKDSEAIIETRNKTLSEIKRIQDRIDASLLNVSRLKEVLAKAKKKINDIDDIVGEKDVDELKQELQDTFKESDKLKVNIDEANAKYAEKRSQHTLINSLEEKIDAQKTENDKYKAQLGAVIERLKEE